MTTKASAAAPGAVQPPAQVRVLRLAVPVPLRQSFDYALPLALPAERSADLPVDRPVDLPAEEAANWLGVRCEIKFGRQTLVGICIETDPADAHAKPKPIIARLDATATISPQMLALGRWLADYYHHPLGEVLPLLLPPPLRRPTRLAELNQARQVMAYRARPLEPAAEEVLATALARSPKKRAALAHLANGPATRVAMLKAGFSGPTLKSLLELGAIESFRTEPRPRGHDDPPTGTALTLSREQQTAVTAIVTGLGQFSPVLLDGVTGSGKTEVYLQAITEALRQRCQVLVLIPEIALTPQTLARFQERFPATECLHSQVADSERLRLWDACREGTIDVLIGTRSAALLPFARLGLIIVDEEHDPSYKQVDGLRYSARDLAVKRAADCQIPLVLGSATPALESLRNARTGRYQHLRLSERAGGASFPTLRLLDIRGQSMHDGLSLPLLREIKRHLDQGNQVLIFINRRGYAPSLLCASCGAAVECPACERPMTYHRRPAGAGHLQCHHCGRQTPEPDGCARCQHPALVPVGIGTQRTELALKERFPNVTIHRIDRDTARSKKRLEAHFAAIHRGNPAILVGTQILAKGHHFPNVTLVGLLNADAGFTAPDFRAAERTAQLIIQVAGRSGRAEQAGEVIIQTLQPEQPLLNALIKAGYAGFAADELERRESAGLPPAAAMLLLRAEAERATDAEQLLHWVLDRVRGQRGGAELLGPVPAPQPKLANRFRYQLLGLHAQRKPLHALADRLTAVLGSKAAQPMVRRARWSLDIDPYDTL